MADRFGLDQNHDNRMDVPNTYEYVHNGAKPGSPTLYDVTFDGSVSSGGHDTSKNVRKIDQYNWEISGPGLSTAITTQTQNPQLVTKLPEGFFTVKLTVTAASRPERALGQSVTATASRKVPIKDFLFIALGDSYSSGEGNPEVPDQSPKEAQWADDGTSNGNSTVARDHRRSHRSTLAWPAQAAWALEKRDKHTSVTFVFLAASGASIPEGLVGPYAGVGPGHNQLPPMQDQVSAAAQLAGDRQIDVLTLSVGGNDVGFARILAGLADADPYFDPSSYHDDLKDVWNTFKHGWRECPDGSSILACSASMVLEPAFDGLPGRYAFLASDIQQQLHPFQTYVLEYPDPTGVLANGNLYFCDGILNDVASGFEIDSDEEQSALANVINPLNGFIAESAQKNGWVLISGIAADFGNGHGYCAKPPGYPPPVTVAGIKVLPAYRGNPYPKEIPAPTDPQTSWFRTFDQSESIQGRQTSNDILFLRITTDVKTKGVMHPNELGHQAIKNRLLDLLILPLEVPGVGLNDWDDQFAEAVPAFRAGQMVEVDKPDSTGAKVRVPLYEGIYPRTDVDMYKFEASASERLEISVPSDSGDGGTPFVRVFDSQGNEVAKSAAPAQINPAPLPGPLQTCSCTAPPGGALRALDQPGTVRFTAQKFGTYYIGVSSMPNVNYDPGAGFGDVPGRGTFNYGMRISDVPGEPDNTLATATPINLGQSITGHAIDSAADVDMFALTLTQPGQTHFSVTYPSTSSLKAHLRVFDPTGKELAAGTTSLSFQFQSAGQYFLGVSGEGTTGYDPAVGIAQPAVLSVYRPGPVTQPQPLGGNVAAKPLPVSTGYYVLSVN